MMPDLKYFFMSLQAEIDWVGKQSDVNTFPNCDVLIDQKFMLIFSYFKSLIKWVYGHVWKNIFLLHKGVGWDGAGLV